MHKKYTATSTIEITRSSTTQPLGLEDLSGIGAELAGGEQISSDLLTQLSVITSETTELNTVKAAHLEQTRPFAIPDGEPSSTALGRERGVPLDRAPFHRQLIEEAFKKNLKVEVVKGTRLMTIAFTDADPALAAAVANGIVQSSKAQFLETRTNASNGAADALQRQVRRLSDEADAADLQVREFQAKHGVSGLSSATPSRANDGTTSTTFNNVPLERLLELNRQLTNAEIAQAEKQAIYDLAQTQDPDVVLGIGSAGETNGAVGSALSVNSIDLQLLQQLRQQRAQTEIRLNSAKQKYGAKNPIITELNVEVASYASQIVDELRKIKERTKNDLQLAIDTVAQLRTEVAAQRDEVARTGSLADEQLVLQERADAARSLYQNLNTKLEEVRVVTVIGTSNIIVVDPALIPALPSSPQPRRNLALGLLIGVVLGVMLIFARAYGNDLVSTPSELSADSALQVLGTIPDFTSAGSRWLSGWLPWKQKIPLGRPIPLWVTTAPQSSLAEAFRSMRTTLLAAHKRQGLRTVLFLSGSQAEGRSTLCWNLAAACAVQGLRVVVVDADLRSGAPGKPVDDQTAGLSSCLEGRSSVDSAVRASPDLPNLSYLPSGPLPPNPSELLGSDRFRNLLQELAVRYDLVCIDSPPASTVTDAWVLAESVDATVLVVRVGLTSRASLRDTLEQMRTLMRSPLGICLNAFNRSGRSSAPRA